MSNVIDITAMQQSVTEIDPVRDYQVQILNGSPRVMVAHRELRGQYVTKGGQGYHTNRSIKVWSCYFLLKALTTSGHIYGWTKNKSLILEWCQCNENTFRRHLAAMVALKLCKVDRHSKSITLVSFEKAAAILEIPFEGTTSIKYNPYKHEGKQIFQFFLRAEEFRSEQQRQLEAFTYHLDKNLSLKYDLHLLLLKHGADDKQLKNSVYFAQRLLQLQMQLFKEGSDLLSYVFSRRADINRSVNLIKEHHHYKSKQSVSYLKRRMARLKVINVQKLCIESEVRSRLYVPDGLDRRRDGYKWLAKKKATALFLTDQITFNYEVLQSAKATAKKAA